MHSGWGDHLCFHRPFLPLGPEFFFLPVSWSVMHNVPILPKNKLLGYKQVLSAGNLNGDRLGEVSERVQNEVCTL